MGFEQKNSFEQLEREGVNLSDYNRVRERIPTNNREKFDIATLGLFEITKQMTKESPEEGLFTNQINFTAAVIISKYLAIHAVFQEDELLWSSLADPEQINWIINHYEVVKDPVESLVGKVDLDKAYDRYTSKPYAGTMLKLIEVIKVVRDFVLLSSAETGLAFDAHCEIAKNFSVFLAPLLLKDRRNSQITETLSLILGINDLLLNKSIKSYANYQDETDFIGLITAIKSTLDKNLNR